MSPKPITIEMRDQEQILLRADLKDENTAKALRAIGLNAPSERQLNANADARAMWFSPDEVLIFVPNAVEAIEKMHDALLAKHLIHDATGARAVFTLKGDYLRDMLAKGTPRDVMKVEIGEVVRTHVGQFAVAFWFLDENTAELVGFRSLAHDIKLWLETEAQPDGLPVLQV